MKNKQNLIVVAIVISVILGMVLTNPTKSAYTDHVVYNISKKRHLSQTESECIRAWINSNSLRKNFLLFSVIYTPFFGNDQKTLCILTSCHFDNDIVFSLSYPLGEDIRIQEEAEAIWKIIVQNVERRNNYLTSLLKSDILDKEDNNNLLKHLLSISKLIPSNDEIYDSLKVNLFSEANFHLSNFVDSILQNLNRSGIAPSKGDYEDISANIIGTTNRINVLSQRYNLIVQEQKKNFSNSIIPYKKIFTIKSNSKS